MWEITEKRNVLISWFVWHYDVALEEMVSMWKNLLVFNMNYFSIRFLLRTLFAPWKKYTFSYGRGFDAGRFLDTLVFNVFSRLIGFIIRTLIIIIGLIAQVMIFVLGILIMMAWILIPLLIIAGIIVSLKWLI